MTRVKVRDEVALQRARSQAGSHTAASLAVARIVAQDVSSEEDRGAFLLDIRSAIANVKHDNIADFLRLVLDTGAWRSYTYPSGDHYEFRSREFDYFLAQIDVDPRMVRDAATYADDPALRVLLVESSLDKAGDDRRSVEDVVAAYPSLGPWLDKYGLRTLGTALLYESPTAREKVAKGAGGNAAANRSSWQVAVFNGGSLAEAIVRKLQRDPALAAEVRDLLSVSEVRTSETCAGCGGALKGRQSVCSKACQKRVDRARKAVR